MFFHFDGVVYSTTVAIGFEMVENLLIAMLIHGIYDSVALVSSASDNGLFVLASVLALVIIMCVLNVNAYKNIKKYVHEDRPVRTKS
jgi:RsiW-degrading membrane proteinase PrsW (M82 family)